MKTIWKFPVEVTDEFTIQIPRGGGVLSVQMQNDVPVMWALVDDAVPMASRRFAVHGTGHPVPNDRNRFIGSFQMMGGRLVFHLFEINSSAAEIG
jgi:hypothetical protein